jgi:hypothetical protein
VAIAKRRERDDASPPTSLDVGILDDGQVVMRFSELIMQMTFTPQQAKALGTGLIEMGTRAESLPRGRMASAVLSRVTH